MSKLLRVAGAAVLALCLGGAGAPKTPGVAPNKGTMANFVRVVLPYADQNFAALRGPKIEWDLADWVYTGYKLRLRTEICNDCRAYDAYGKGAQREQWYVVNVYTEDPSGDLVEPFAAIAAEPTPSPAASASPGAEVPPPFLQISPQPEWSIDKTEAYVKSQLAPLVPGFSLRRTTSVGITGERVPTLVWNGPNNVWVEAKLYPKMAAGMIKASVAVGHDLPKSVHVLATPTKSQLAQMQTAIRGIIRTAVPAAPGDFLSLRGAPANEDAADHDYRVPVSFGPAFRPCEVLDIAARVGKSWDRKSQPVSVMQCRTFSMLGTRAKLEQVVRSAVSGALPTRFAAVIDPKNRWYYDYLWTNGKGVAVAIDWGDPTSGTVVFSIRIMHFLPRQ